MSRILVVGAGGYLGIPLCEELVSRGHYVMAMDRWFFGRYPQGNVGHFHADIRSADKLILDSYDAVIDLCGLSNDASADIDPELTLDINLRGACRLADMAKRAGVKRYVYSSSCSVYGNGSHTGLIEESPCKPLTLYAECKVRVEDHLRSIADDTFKPVILRNATVFGVAPRMRFDLAVNVMTLRAWRDGLLYVMGSGEQFRPFVSVNDVVEVMCAALDCDFGTVNVGNDGNNLSIHQLALMVQGKLPLAKLHMIPDDPDKRSYHVSFRKLMRQLPSKMWETVENGIDDVRDALKDGEISGDDPTTHTLSWYKTLMDWEKRLNAIRLDGRIL